MSHEPHPRPSEQRASGDAGFGTTMPMPTQHGERLGAAGAGDRTGGFRERGAATEPTVRLPRPGAEPSGPGGPAPAQGWGTAEEWGRSDGWGPQGAATGPVQPLATVPVAASPAGSSSTPTTTTRQRFPWGAVALVALLSAGLASAGTWAADRYLDDDDQHVAATASPVTQARDELRATTTSNPAAPTSWGKVAAAVNPSVVAIELADGNQPVGSGSGVIIDKQGHILTNNHVVAEAAGGQLTLQVMLADRTVYDAQVVGTDPGTDLAVIKIAPPQDIVPIEMGDSDQLKVGDNVMAVGNPLGLAGTVTTGIVSATNRPVRTQQVGSDGTPGEPVVTNAVQTSAAINPGNSGGALVDSAGRLVGINSSIATLGGNSGDGGAQSGSIGIGFAIPVNEARNVAEQLITHRQAQHPFLGVTADSGIVDLNGTRRAAAVLQGVSPGSPAQKAGIRSGDAIIAVNEEPVDSMLSLIAQIRERQVGQNIVLTVVRGGKSQQVQVALTARSTSQG